MNIHKNARLTPFGRERMVQMLLSGRAAEAAGARATAVCPRTARLGNLFLRCFCGQRLASLGKFFLTC